MTTIGPFEFELNPSVMLPQPDAINNPSAEFWPIVTVFSGTDIIFQSEVGILRFLRSLVSVVNSCAIHTGDRDGYIDFEDYDISFGVRVTGSVIRIKTDLGETIHEGDVHVFLQQVWSALNDASRMLYDEPFMIEIQVDTKRPFYWKREQ